MATLTLRHQRRFYEPRLPHLIFIDDLYAGTMQGETQIQMPAGHYKMRVQFGGKIPLGKSGKSVDLSVSSTCDNVEVKQHTTFLFRDREWLWNLLFDIDLIVWLVSLFIPLTRLYRPALSYPVRFLLCHLAGATSDYTQTLLPHHYST